MKTNIEYADEVSNPLYARLKDDETSKIGTFCEKPDADGTCKNCWAETLNLRFGNKLPFDKANRNKVEWKFRFKELNRLAGLNAKKARSVKFPGLPLIVFCCDTFDIFQPSIAESVRDIIFNYYDEMTNLILLIQTTYPVRMKHYFKARYGATGLPSHYWIGMSAGNQWWFDNHIGALQLIKASEKYVIFEPLLGDIKFDVSQIIYDANVNKSPQFTFAIIGGESGANARYSHISNIRSVATQLRSAGIKVFIKQLGSNFIQTNGLKEKLKNKKGGDLNEFPNDLKIRDFPAIRNVLEAK